MYAQLGAMTSELSALREQVEAQTVMLRRHIDDDAERRIEMATMRQAMGTYAEDFSRHGRQHDENERRLRELENDYIERRAQKLPERLAAVEHGCQEEQKARAKTVGALSVWSRIWPILAGAGGGGGVVALATEAIRSIGP